MKNGFTLIELLAVIIVLAVISLITVVAVDSTVSKSKETLSDTQKTNIEEAAKAYYLKEGMSNNDTCINVSKLIEKGYIEGNVVTDPKDKEEMTGSVKITYEANQYSYEYQEKICGVCTYEDKDSSGTINLSDVVTCGTENFYVVSNVDNKVVMLTEKNINVTGVGDVKQMDDAGTIQFSETMYWIDDGTTSGNVLSKYGTDSYPYVYDENSTIYGYLENYSKYLSNTIDIIDIKLLNIEQAQSIVGTCDLSGTLAECQDSAPWLFTTTTWLGNFYGYDNVTGISNMGALTGFTYSPNGYYDTDGVRPVVTILSSQIIK